MVVLADGRTAGTLSGGCLEADLLRRAAWIVRNGAAMEHFSTTFDDTAEVPYGLGCGGELDILAEPLGTPEACALLQAFEASLRGEARTVLTVLPRERLSTSSSHFARIVFDGRTLLFASEGLKHGPAAHLLHTEVDEGGTADLANTLLSGVFVEHIPAAQRIVIFGAGEDAKPLVRLGAEMGFSMIVTDSRAQLAKPERFPQAEAVLFAHSSSAVPVLPHDAVVLMTHSYEQDRRLLTELLPLAPCYLGLLGARHRSALLLREASELCGMPLSGAVERTHAPIGLELGGDGPEAVALAIIAEIQQTLSTKQPTADARRLTLAQAEQLLSESTAGAYLHETCVLYAEAVT